MAKVNTLRESIREPAFNPLFCERCKQKSTKIRRIRETNEFEILKNRDYRDT